MVFRIYYLSDGVGGLRLPDAEYDSHQGRANRETLVQFCGGEPLLYTDLGDGRTLITWEDAAEQNFVAQQHTHRDVWGVALDVTRDELARVGVLRSPALPRPEALDFTDERFRDRGIPTLGMRCAACGQQWLETGVTEDEFYAKLRAEGWAPDGNTGLWSCKDCARVPEVDKSPTV
jgi:hypothetical protein